MPGLSRRSRVEALGGGHGLEQFVAPVVARAAPLSPRDRDAEPPGEGLDGFGELEPVDLAHEVDDVAARAAPEAVVQPLVAVHGEGGSALVVERAESLPGAAGFLEAGVVSDHLDDVGRHPKLGEHPVIDVEIGSQTFNLPQFQAYLSSRIVAPFPPSLLSAERSFSTAG